MEMGRLVTFGRRDNGISIGGHVVFQNPHKPFFLSIVAPILSKTLSWQRPVKNEHGSVLKQTSEATAPLEETIQKLLPVPKEYGKPQAEILVHYMLTIHHLPCM